MAGDSRSRTEFPLVLQRCIHQTHVISQTHGKYLNIIDELKCELDSLSSEVCKVQEELGEQSVSDAEEASSFSAVQFETVMEELLEQNERLEEALERTTKEKTTAHKDLENTNETLKCQIENLQQTIIEKEQSIAQLNTMLSQLSNKSPHNICKCCGGRREPGNEAEVDELRSQMDQMRCRIESLLYELENSQKQERFLHAESRKLNDELLHNKRKNNDLMCQIRRLAGLLKSQEAHRMDLTKKFEIVEQNYGEQSKKLRAAHAQLNLLQERFSQAEKKDDEINMERNLLREEVLALKEKEACMLGKHKSLQDQLVKTERELYKAHDVIKEQRCILQRNNATHKDIVKRLQEASSDIKQQLNAVLEDYKRLEGDYKKLSELCTQNDKIIESFRKWKEVQLQADEATRNSFNQYEEHIKLLLEEKQKFLERYRKLFEDYNLVQCELERLKICTLSTSAPSLNFLDNPMYQRADLLRNTYRRLSEKCNTLQDEERTNTNERMQFRTPPPP